MTQIGFVGLGKMGGGMVHRIRRDSDHEVVAFDFDEKAVKQAVKYGAGGAGSLRELVKKLEPPRMVWIMVPAGAPTQETVDKLAKLLDRGDTIIDGGNSKWTDDKRRAAELKKAGIDYVDVGVSGGVWGLEVGYCMMVGGPKGAVKRLAPILDVLAPPTNEQSRGGDRRSRLDALRPDRRGALREDGPQRRRVRADAGLRRGLRHLRQERVRARQREDRPPLGPGLGCPLVALRTRGARVRTRRQRPRGDRGLDRRLRRGALDDPGRDRPRRPDARDHRLALLALPLARERRLRRQGARRRCATSSAGTPWSPRPKDRVRRPRRTARARNQPKPPKPRKADAERAKARRRPGAADGGRGGTADRSASSPRTRSRRASSASRSRPPRS